MALFSRLRRNSARQNPRPLGAPQRAAWMLGAVAVAAAVIGVAAPAHAVALDYAITSGHVNFGPVKHGTSATQRFDITNTGDDDLIIDPSAIEALTTPFVAGNFTFGPTDHIRANGGVASFTVTYTAQAAGVNAQQPVTVVMVDADDNTQAPLSVPLLFQGQSVAVDPLHFTISASGGASTVDFGSVSVGHSATQTVTLTNDGVLNVTFKNSGVSVTDTAGAALPDVALSSSSFGNAGTVYRPGESATFALTFTPTGPGTTTGVVHVVGTQFSEDPEPPQFVQTIALAGAATAAVPPTSPPTVPTTAPPTSPSTSTPTPTATPIVVTAGGSAGTGTGSGSGAGFGQLASTGLATQSPVLIAAAATSLGVAAVLLGIAYRRFARRERKQ